MSTVSTRPPFVANRSDGSRLLAVDRQATNERVGVSSHPRRQDVLEGLLHSHRLKNLPDGKRAERHGRPIQSAGPGAPRALHQANRCLAMAHKMVDRVLAKERAPHADCGTIRAIPVGPTANVRRAGLEARGRAPAWTTPCVSHVVSE